MNTTIGETLREARQAKRVTLEDAARATKVKVDTLEKLEADDTRNLAAPMYVKGFIKIYADYLGLNGQEVADAYLKSQGGVRRQGLQLETEANMRERKTAELQLPIAGVVMAVAGVTLVVLLFWGARQLWSHRSRSTTPVTTIATVPLPQANFDAYYQPKTKPAPSTLENAPR